MEMNADVVIVGTGVGGLFSALNLPADRKIIMITKSDLESSDSFLAQGGICVLRDDNDYDSWFEDTMRAGHYENRRESVDIMIRGMSSMIWSDTAWSFRKRTASMRLQGKGRIHGRGSCSMRTSQEKRSQASFSPR